MKFETRLVEIESFRTTKVNDEISFSQLNEEYNVNILELESISPSNIYKLLDELKEKGSTRLLVKVPDDSSDTYDYEQCDDILAMANNSIDKTYTVNAGDTIEKILDSFEISIEDLFEFNNRTGLILAEGQVINV